MITPTHLHAFNSSLIALPVAVAFARRLLLTHKSPLLVGASPADEKIKAASGHADNWTGKFKHIKGYDHFGLNE